MLSLLYVHGVILICLYNNFQRLIALAKGAQELSSIYNERVRYTNMAHNWQNIYPRPTLHLTSWVQSHRHRSLRPRNGCRSQSKSNSSTSPALKYWITWISRGYAEQKEKACVRAARWASVLTCYSQSGCWQDLAAIERSKWSIVWC